VRFNIVGRNRDRSRTSEPALALEKHEHASGDE